MAGGALGLKKRIHAQHTLLQEFAGEISGDWHTNKVNISSTPATDKSRSR